MKKKRNIVTAALPYANGPIHIGHLAGVYIPSDIYARYLRLRGEEVLFICGSDEHGVPVAIKARQDGKSVQDVVDHYHNLIKNSFENFGISFDYYGRTSSDLHHKTASDFFKELYEEGIFEEKITEQLYDEKVNQFLADRFVVGICPNCNSDGCYGDQCESCGASHDVRDIINPKSTLTGTIPTLKETKHWFLPLNKYQKWLEEWHSTHKGIWRNNVYGQVKGWLDEGLKARAVTRDLDWGVPVPIEDAKGKVLYVWFDAPIGYISATKEWAKQNNKNWELYWKDSDTDLIHFIGKDNIVFHTIIFPVMLKAQGEYILPRQVPANEFLKLEGKKLSTSKNWAVWLHEYLEAFPDQQDTLRYVLTINAPESKDNDFTWSSFQSHHNNELVAIYGNFINRTLVLIQKYYDGRVPQKGNLKEQDKKIFSVFERSVEKIAVLVEKFKFREAITELINIARLGNKYLADEEPWKLIKENPDRTSTILYLAVQLVAGLTIVSEPFLPYTTRKLERFLNLENSTKNWDTLLKNSMNQIASNEILPKPSLLFSKIEDKQIEDQINLLTK